MSLVGTPAPTKTPAEAHALPSGPTGPRPLVVSSNVAATGARTCVRDWQLLILRKFGPFWAFSPAPASRPSDKSNGIQCPEEAKTIETSSVKRTARPSSASSDALGALGLAGGTKVRPLWSCLEPPTARCMPCMHNGPLWAHRLPKRRSRRRPTPSQLTHRVRNGHRSESRRRKAWLQMRPGP